MRKKVTQSQDQLAPMMGWVDTIPMPVVRLIGVIELLGVAGLVLPPLTGIAPVLAIAAAVGFVILQLLATGLHLRRGEAKVIGLNRGLDRPCGGRSVACDSILSSTLVPKGARAPARLPVLRLRFSSEGSRSRQRLGRCPNAGPKPARAAIACGTSMGSGHIRTSHAASPSTHEGILSVYSMS